MFGELGVGKPLWSCDLSPRGVSPELCFSITPEVEVGAERGHQAPGGPTVPAVGEDGARRHAGTDDIRAGRSGVWLAVKRERELQRTLGNAGAVLISTRMIDQTPNHNSIPLQIHTTDSGSNKYRIPIDSLIFH